MIFEECQDIILEEKNVFNDLLQHVREKKSFYFLSGAGSGKTHALINLIKCLKGDEGENLSASGQRILCITYTNNARDEIVRRLGESELIYVSTIHQFLWDMIEHHMNALLEIHASHLNYLIDMLDSKLSCPDNYKPAYKAYRGLCESEIQEVKGFILQEDEKYYRLIDLDAKSFWIKLKEIIGDELGSKLDTNKSDIVDIFSYLRKINNYKSCLKKIHEGCEGFDTIKYSIKNSECLYKNRIGHDTLLLYAYKLMSGYPYFANIVIDKFPYIFIDEYQDTHDNVVAFFQLTLERLESSNSQCLIGLFGDPSQEIYNLGARTSVLTFNEIYKNINRRSHDQIIDCINNIRGRHQPIRQVSIFRNKNIGSVKCYIYPISKCNKENIEEIISSYQNRWSVSLSNQMACLVSKNEMLAEICNFSDLYSKVRDLFIAENKINYNKVNNEFIVNSIDKFGSFASILYEYCNPPYMLKLKSDAPIIELFPKLYLQECTVKDVGIAVSKLNALSYTTLGEYFYKLNWLFKTTRNKRVKSLIESLFPVKFDSDEAWKEQIVKDCGLRKVKFDDAVFQKLLEVDFDEVTHWMNYINSNKIDSPVNVMTCHSSKGLEFENVIVFLNDKMKKKQTYFSSLINSDLNVELSPDLEEVRRLLYVSTSRAVKNLRVVLFSDNKIEKDNIQKIFNDCVFNS
ncbi:UvrD/REP helicase [Pantoea ananatis LMG 5342]|uniref:UvrD-helicase domain-containing protein n=1 Tax=Pantoea ananas TaxID=553 RepID=UPI000241704D|nr:ATP-dependent helicase [Pantoea ananatis]CCF08883.1 UvrD/REP helicase [Pantoea ananatis LMG 5342]